MPNWLVSFQLALHVTAGYIGALLAFPLAVGARKGGNWHKLSGRLFVGTFLIICLTGYILDWDLILDLNLFRPWASPNLIPPLYEADHAVHARHLIILGTSAINTFALYLAISGWRVWSRRNATSINKSQWLDQLLAVFELIACVGFIVAFWQLIPALGKSPLLLGLVPVVAAIPLIDAGNDLLQLVRGISPAHWWIQHVRKLAMAEGGLLAAVALRCTPEPYVLASMAASVLLIAIPTVLLVRRQLHAS